jgi:hypothetical protein
LPIPVSDSVSFFSDIPSSHPRKAGVEAAVRAVLADRGRSWTCAIRCLRTDGWAVVVGCPSVGFELGFRVDPADQNAGHVAGWLARLMDPPLVRAPEVPSPTVLETHRWRSGGFGYEDRRRPPAPGAVPYQGVERRAQHPG